MNNRAVSFIFGGVIAVAVMTSGLSGNAVTDVWRLFSDACFVPGVLLSGIGMLIRIGELGVFDMLAYGVSGITRVFIGKERDSYHDYKQKRHGKPLREEGLLLAGGVYLCLAVVFYLFGGRDRVGF